MLPFQLIDLVKFQHSGVFFNVAFHDKNEIFFFFHFLRKNDWLDFYLLIHHLKRQLLRIITAVMRCLEIKKQLLLLHWIQPGIIDFVHRLERLSLVLDVFALILIEGDSDVFGLVDDLEIGDAAEV